MKFLKRIRARLNSFLSPQPGKTGSSMAFVMIIGAVLVIWVLAIMPLMVAVGNNSLLTQGSYADYLQSRSAIEFCKGELEKIVETKPPYTFCVVKNDNGSYSPIPKMESNSLTDDYKAVIAYDQTDDTKDKPLDGANNVVAICAVSQDNNAENVYHITITTYNNGKKNLTYTADYTIRGSLLINPESYKQTQALPLSDFVVVDGKLGSNTLWDSTIHSLSFSTKDSDNVTNLYAIHENFKPYISTALPGSGYADSGVFPSVFKTPVYPAIGGSDGDSGTDSDITEDTNVGWIRPKAVKEGKEPGVIYFTHHAEGDEHVNNNIINIYVVIDDNGNEINITDTEMCEIYINGNKHVNYHDDCTIIPEGIYQVSIDFKGTNRILPVNGLILGEIGEASTSNTVKQTAPVANGVSISGTTVTVNSHASNTGVTYGYCAVEDFPEINEINEITWNPNSNDASFQIADSSKAYYFFAYRKAYYQNGTYYAASDVTYMGCVYPMETTTQLQDGFDYLIVAKDSSGNYHAMGRNNSNSITQQDIGTLPTLIASTPNYSNDYLWHVEGSNNTFTFRNKGNNKYLSLTGTYTTSWLFWGSWSFSLSLDDGTNNASFTYNGKKLSRSIKSGRQITSGYINFESESFKAGDSGSEIYFVKMPVEAPAEPDLSLLQNTDFVKLTEDKIVHGTPLSSVVSGTYDALKANGSNNTDNLNAGKYNVTAVVEGHTVNLGMIEVEKASLDNKPAVTESHNKHNVTVKITVKNFGKDFVRWIGYKPTDSSDYKWFPAYDENGDDIEFRKFTLPYGDYEFVVYETGSKNYNPVMSDPVPVSLTEPAEEAPGDGEEGGSGDSYSEASMMMGSSLYFMGRDGSIMTEGTTIYLTTDLLVMRHGIVGDGEVYIYPYSNEQNYDESAADTLFFPVNTMRNAAGFEFKACTFYWIPAGTDINHATAESLNFEKRPPLSLDNDEEYDRLKILLRKGDYPDINMDVAYIDRENKADKVNANGTPNNEQLAHIVSGETIGWTVNGELVNGNDKNYGNSNNGFDSTNRQFVVCAYISKVKDTTIARTANRILIASEETDANGIKSFSLSVPNSVTFTCRYFSVYANTIIQSSNKGEMRIKNLGKDGSFRDFIKELLDLSDYSSKSLQIDFELMTSVYYMDINAAGNLINYTRQPGIYRLDAPEEGVNLFSEYELMPLMVTYTNTEIESWFGWASNAVRIVDRYLTIMAGDDPNLSVGSLFSSNLSIYSNYLYIDKDITGYTFSRLIGSADFIINSQERGYKSEYLGFFTQNTAETYNGTIIYIAPDNKERPLGSGNGGIRIVQKSLFNTKTTDIPSGFYYIPACEDGTSITELALLTNDPNNAYFYGDNPNDGTNAYRINPADLPKYSIYIKDDGTLSDAYVDTGLIGNSNLGESGFSGGNVG